MSTPRFTVATLCILTDHGDEGRRYGGHEVYDAHTRETVAVFPVRRDAFLRDPAAWRAQMRLAEADAITAARAMNG